jgi:hypothetical protein
MRRGEFIKFLGGAAAGWPLAAHAQQSTGRRRIGALMNIAENDPQSLVWASLSSAVCGNEAGHSETTCRSNIAGPTTKTFTGDLRTNWLHLVPRLFWL